MTSNCLVSVLAFTLGCGATVRTDPVEPTAKRRGTRPAKGVVGNSPLFAPGRGVMLGEMCPQAPAGRPGVLPVFLNRATWGEGGKALHEAIERRHARQFSVYGWSGQRVGLFSVAGMASRGDQRFAIGSYAGASPCVNGTLARGSAEPNAACVSAQGHCGLAVAELEPSGGFEARPHDEDRKPSVFAIGGACVDKGHLVVDVDGDGRTEAFALTQFVGEGHHPAPEMSAVGSGEFSCVPQFAVASAMAPGGRHWRGLDILGVLDIDGDGRFEVVAVLRFPSTRTWALYSARQMATRLDLVGEATPWPRP